MARVCSALKAVLIDGLRPTCGKVLTRPEDRRMSFSNRDSRGIIGLGCFQDVSDCVLEQMAWHRTTITPDATLLLPDANGGFLDVIKIGHGSMLRNMILEVRSE
jgi:hypothetical protein